MTLAALRHLVAALDASKNAPLDQASSDAAEAAWASAKKAAKETFAPCKMLLDRGRASSMGSMPVLQLAIATGGQLKELADALLREEPREVWQPETAPVVLKTGGVCAVHRGQTRLAAWSDGKGKLDVIDLDTLLPVWSVKLGGRPRAVSFVDESTLLAVLADGRVVEHGRTDKKPRVLQELGAVERAYIDGARVVAARERAVDDGVIVEIVDDGKVVVVPEARAVVALGTFSGRVVAGVVSPEDLGGVVLLDGDRPQVRWLARLPSGGTAPPRAEIPDDFVLVGGERYVITTLGGPSAHRWLRFDDLQEEPRFGNAFENVTVLDDAVWSHDAERVSDGQRRAPIWFEGLCQSCIPLASDVVVTVSCDSAFKKTFLTRWRRYAPPSAAAAA